MRSSSFVSVDVLLTQGTCRGINNEVIRVIWTPGLVLMERRQNQHSVTDRSINLYERAATYDGKPHSCKSYEAQLCAMWW